MKALCENRDQEIESKFPGKITSAPCYQVGLGVGGEIKKGINFWPTWPVGGGSSADVGGTAHSSGSGKMIL